MSHLLENLKAAYKQFNFTPGEVLFWSPKDQTIYFTELSDDESIWGLFHEIGHGLLAHTEFHTDADLLRKEVSAWAEAKRIAKQYGELIQQEHIENCLDSYRDWLHKRSECPTCHGHGIQDPQKLYRCLNCSSVWKVSASNACRPYRLSTSLAI